MRVIDPGHKYGLKHLDGPGEEVLTCVKREGAKYPGNSGSYPGTNIQEGCRAYIDRLLYLDNQESHPANLRCIQHFRQIILELEVRAAERHGRVPCLPEIIETEPTCDVCGHIGCDGQCHE